MPLREPLERLGGVRVGAFVEGAEPQVSRAVFDHRDRVHARRSEAFAGDLDQPSLARRLTAHAEAHQAACRSAQQAGQIVGSGSGQIPSVDGIDPVSGLEAGAVCRSAIEDSHHTRGFFPAGREGKSGPRVRTGDRRDERAVRVGGLHHRLHAGECNAG
jgi:hypothetical protein